MLQKNFEQTDSFHRLFLNHSRGAFFVGDMTSHLASNLFESDEILHQISPATSKKKRRQKKLALDINNLSQHRNREMRLKKNMEFLKEKPTRKRSRMSHNKNQLGPTTWEVLLSSLPSTLTPVSVSLSTCRILYQALFTGGGSRSMTQLGSR